MVKSVTSTVFQGQMRVWILRLKGNGLGRFCGGNGG